MFYRLFKEIFLCIVPMLCQWKLTIRAKVASKTFEIYNAQSLYVILIVKGFQHNNSLPLRFSSYINLYIFYFSTMEILLFPYMRNIYFYIYLSIGKISFLHFFMRIFKISISHIIQTFNNTTKVVLQNVRNFYSFRLSYDLSIQYK